MIGFLKVIVSGKDGEIYNVGNNLEEIYNPAVIVFMVNLFSALLNNW